MDIWVKVGLYLVKRILFENVNLPLVSSMGYPYYIGFPY